jgi:hypothetical protein
MIDLLSGIICFDDGLQLGPGFNKEKLMLLPGTRSIPGVGNRIQLSLGAHMVQEMRWGIGVIFSDAMLQQLWLQCLNADGVDNDAIDFANEMKRRDFHDKWLDRTARQDGENLSTDNLAMKFKFKWGQIESILDTRAVQALIIIDYQTQCF